MQTVKVYGRENCEDTRHTLAYLDSIEIRYEYVDIDEDAEGMEFVERQNSGKQRTPTLDIDGRILAEPSDAELESVLKEKQLA